MGRHCNRNQEMWLLVQALSKLPLWPLAQITSAFCSRSSFPSNEGIKIGHYVWAWTHPTSSAQEALRLAIKDPNSPFPPKSSSVMVPHFLQW